MRASRSRSDRRTMTATISEVDLELEVLVAIVADRKQDGKKDKRHEDCLRKEDLPNHVSSYLSFRFGKPPSRIRIRRTLVNPSS